MNTNDEVDEVTFASAELDEADQAVLAAIAALYDQIDPLPDGLVERLQFEITLDALQAEVATLTKLDLSASGARSAGSATSESVRTITVSGESVTTMVTITPQQDGTIRLDGWAVPGAGLVVEVLLADGSRRTGADADGRFAFDGLPTGLAKIAVHSVDHTGTPHVVVSPTIEL